MDQGRREVERLKAMKFPRSYKEATGCNFAVERKSSKLPFVAFTLCLILLLAVL
jgi:hypothetical protein